MFEKSKELLGSMTADELEKFLISLGVEFTDRYKYKESKAWLRYYAYEISEQYQYIKGLEKYDIYNDDLEEHYMILCGLIESANNRLLEFRQNSVKACDINE